MPYIKGMTQDEIAKLSTAERLALIADLWDSVADEDVPLTQAQRDELDRRLSTFESDAAQAVSWETVKAELGARKR
jgi:putative addiction module component (TIGR02574 family)